MVQAPLTPANRIIQSSHPLRIFVVENHEDTRVWFVRYLEISGHTVRSATSMQEALEALPGSDCEVLICDIGLPDGDGWELLRRLQMPRTIYAIAMSGFGAPSDREKSRAAGYRHHLIKPFVPEDLNAALADAVRDLALPT